MIYSFKNPRTFEISQDLDNFLFNASLCCGKVDVFHKKMCEKLGFFEKKIHDFQIMENGENLKHLKPMTLLSIQ